MRRGSTPRIVALVENFDLTSVDAAYLTIKSRTQIVSLGKERLTISVKTQEDGRKDSYITAALSQEETLSFENDERIYVQLRWRMDTDAYTSEIVEAVMGEVLKDGVI